MYHKEIKTILLKREEGTLKEIKEVDDDLDANVGDTFCIGEESNYYEVSDIHTDFVVSDNDGYWTITKRKVIVLGELVSDFEDENYETEEENGDLFKSFSINYKNGIVIFVEFDKLFPESEIENLDEITQNKEDISEAANWLNRAGYTVTIFCNSWWKYFQVVFYQKRGYFDEEIIIERI